MKNSIVLIAALLSSLAQAQQLETGGPANGLGAYGNPIQNYPVTAVAYEYVNRVSEVKNVAHCNLEHYQWQGNNFVWVNTDYNTTACRAYGTRFYRVVPTEITYERIETKTLIRRPVQSSGSLSSTAAGCFDKHRQILEQALGNENVREKLASLGLNNVVLLVSDYSSLDKVPENAKYGAKSVEDALKVMVIARRAEGPVPPCLGLEVTDLESVIGQW